MSDRTRGLQAAQTATEGHSPLEDLSASRDLHKTTGAELSTQPANQADLTSASLSSANVTRVPHRPELRRDISPQNRSDTTRTASQSRDSRASSKANHGIIANPRFKYSGGLASRIISFIANILKVIERLILRLLAGPDRAAVTPNRQSPSATPTQKEGSSSETTKQDRQKHGRTQNIARS